MKEGPYEAINTLPVDVVRLAAPLFDPYDKSDQRSVAWMGTRCMLVLSRGVWRYICCRQRAMEEQVMPLTDRFYTRVKLDTQPYVPIAVNFPVEVGDWVSVEIVRRRLNTTPRVDMVSGLVISVTQVRIFE